MEDPADAPSDPPADTDGDQSPTPESGARKLLRQKMQKVIDDDAEDDPDEMTGNDPVAQARGRERTRCAAIMNCSAAKDRKNYAGHLAFNTRLTREQAINLLERAPKETAGAGYSSFALQSKTSIQLSAEHIKLGWDQAMARARGETVRGDDPHGWDDVMGRVQKPAEKRRKH